MRNMPRRNNAVRHKKNLSFVDIYGDQNPELKPFVDTLPDCCAFLTMSWEKEFGEPEKYILWALRESKRQRRPIVLFATTKEKEYLQLLQKCPWKIAEITTKSQMGRYQVSMIILDGCRQISGEQRKHHVD